MKRRSFLMKATVGVAATTMTAPAIAQSSPKINWRLTSSFPKNVTLYGTGEYFANIVREVTDGNFNIQVFAPGELVPALQALDATVTNTVECCYTAPYYYWGKDPTWALATGLPFGLNSRQMNAWLYFGGGIELLNDFFRTQGVYGLPSGNTNAQMGGWFRKEINTLADLNGLKFRIGGTGGAVMAKLGVVPQQIAGGEVYTALEKGTIDAAEWNGPYDDEKLGFYKVAPYYYYPGWAEGTTTMNVFINLQKWNELPDRYKTAVKVASEAANANAGANFEYHNAMALKSVVAKGAKLRRFSQEILDASFDAAVELYDEIMTTNAPFKKIWENQVAYRNDAYVWAQIAEGGYDNFMISLQRAGKLKN